MQWIQLCFAALLGISFSAHSETKKLIIVGDSITEGYGVPHDKAFPALLQKKLNEKNIKWQVVNGGVSGSMASSAPSRVQSFLREKPALILIALGTNDGLQGTPVKNVDENLGLAISACKKANVQVVLAGMVIPSSDGNSTSSEFEAVFPNLAKKYEIALIPYLLEGVGGIRDLNLADGIHPNVKGHARIAEHLFLALKSYLH